MIDSLVAAACRNQEVNDMPKSDYELVTKAESCKNAIECYINKLSVIKTLLAIERDGLSRTKYDALCSEYMRLNTSRHSKIIPMNSRTLLHLFVHIPLYGSCAEKHSNHI